MWVAKLRAFAADAPRKLHILGHNSNTFGMNSTQIRVFKQSYEMGFGRMLQGKHGRTLKSQVTVNMHRNLTDQPLERELANEQISRLLVSADFAKGHSSGSITVGLLDPTRRWTVSNFGRQQLSRGLPSGALTRSGLLGTSH